jgi:hypothetical protein
VPQEVGLRNVRGRTIGSVQGQHWLFPDWQAAWEVSVALVLSTRLSQGMDF